MRKPRYGTPDDENPEWTAEDFAKARPVCEVLPPKLFAALTNRKPGTAETEPSEMVVRIRLDREVVEAFQATGAGWQARINAELRRAAKRLHAASPSTS